MDRRILVVDDSELICQQLSQLLASPDRQIKVAHDGTTALEWLVERTFSLVLTDLRLPGIGGLDLIREIRHRDLPVTVIVMTGHASIDSAVEAMKLGAYDFIHKPIDSDPARAPGRPGARGPQAASTRSADLRNRLRRRYAYHNLLGRSPRMREVFARVERVASSACTVLITGETGTGKELVAQAIHYTDATRHGPLVAVNCAALPEPLLESELFGHERGAFTGADRQKKGRFEQASGGTLLLDEIGELPLGMQAKLLRVLQDGTFERVGGTEAIQADCRVIAADQPATWPRPSPPAGSARTCITGSTSSRSSCPRSASGSRTSRSWSTTSSRSWSERRLPAKTRRARDPLAAAPATTGPATSASSST